MGVHRQAHQSGCPMCKPNKYRQQGQAERKPWAELRYLGKRKRVSRHDLGIEG